MRNQRLYEKFLSTKQEKIKLEIALEELLYEDDLEDAVKETYLSYIKRRRRSAILLAKEVEKREFMWKTSIEKDFIWGNVRWNLSRKYSYFSGAFSMLMPKPVKGDTVGSDGTFLYYPKDICKEQAKAQLQELCVLYFHTVLHCYFGHIFMDEKVDKKRWDLACDIYVEEVLRKDFPKIFPMTLQEEVQKKYLGEAVRKREEQEWKVLNDLRQEIGTFQLDTIYDWLKGQGNIQKWEELFCRDDHKFWENNSYKTCNGQEEQRSKQRMSLAKNWVKIKGQVISLGGQSSGKRGSSVGGACYDILLRKEKKYDYKRFLERFTFFGEEMMLDMENFDYIPYVYSRDYYKNLVFLEPLEYAEVHKLKELVIAIDTSGSCRGKIVQQFLEETYEILSRQENFFKKMKVYVIQCDSMIQDCVCIENQEQWKDYVKHLKVKGLGGTDFRPVFDEIEKLRKRKELLDLKGLIYFTDGDGIYPRTAPDYETAFVFLNDTLKKGTTPSWVTELVLQISVDEVGDSL